MLLLTAVCGIANVVARPRPWLGRVRLAPLLGGARRLPAAARSTPGGGGGTT